MRLFHNYQLPQSTCLEQTETDLTAHTIATDGIGIILHSDNPVTHLSDDQVRGIYTEKIRNWRALGSAGAEGVDRTGTDYIRRNLYQPLKRKRSA